MIEIKENYLSQEQLQKVWSEIEMIKPLIFDNTATGEAENKKKGFGRLFNSFMAKNVIPNIFSISGDEETSVLVNYFPDGGYYKQHTDECDKTSVLMLALDDGFIGGDLVFEECVCKFQNNTMISFNKIPHEVSEVKYIKPSKGRFSINYFKKETQK